MPVCTEIQRLVVDTGRLHSEPWPAGFDTRRASALLSRPPGLTMLKSRPWTAVAAAIISLFPLLLPPSTTWPLFTHRR